MHLVLGQVRKPIRELSKSLRDLPGNPTRRAVHNLRTRSRRLEAVAALLLLHDNQTARQLLKSIKAIRKTAGDVRDMDVLEAKVRFLIRSSSNQPISSLSSFERLLAHLQAIRAESARELVQSFSADRKNLRRSLKSFSKCVEEEFTPQGMDARQAHAVFEELCRWPRLCAQNLHAFRIKIKELRYMLQLMECANQALLNALDRAKTRIGAWHDWEQLHRIALEFLHPRRDRVAIAVIADTETTELKSAMHTAQSLRTRYLRTSNLLEIAEP